MNLTSLYSIAVLTKNAEIISQIFIQILGKHVKINLISEIISNLIEFFFNICLKIRGYNKIVL